MVAQAWGRIVGKFVQNEGFYDTFTIDGRAPREGELFRCPAMADTLEEICASQGESFYRGDLAQKIAADCARHNGVMTPDDLASHEGFWTDCIALDYAGLTVHEIPPSGQGIVTLIDAKLRSVESVYTSLESNCSTALICWGPPLGTAPHFDTSLDASRWQRHCRASLTHPFFKHAATSDVVGTRVA